MDTMEALRSLVYGNDTPSHVRKAARQALWSVQAMQRAAHHARLVTNPSDDDRMCGVLPSDRAAMRDEALSKVFQRVPRGFAPRD